MRTALILALITLITLIGDYLIKLAATKSGNVVDLRLVGGAICYALTGIGWYFMMRTHTLAEIGVLYSASTMLLLAGLGYFVFNEAFGLREVAGLTLAVMAVVVMGADH